MYATLPGPYWSDLLDSNGVLLAPVVGAVLNTTATGAELARLFLLLCLRGAVQSLFRWPSSSQLKQRSAGLHASCGAW